ncbi:hypothetical protein O3M35_003713 [Rhynocoris fuscipes]|uniref:Coatomer subunit beta n=1 Tax=Rhynocoris fuscipes TaxID=488301 RepID=A0AAW1CNE3_9HEMI
MLKKEVTKTHNLTEHEDTGRYRQLLVRTLHCCCMKFPDIAASVIPVVMEFLSDNGELASYDVLVFVREAIHKFEHLRPLIIQRLLEVFRSIKSVRVHRASLWILGEYTSGEDIISVLKQIRLTLGELPLVDYEIQVKTTADKTSEESENAGINSKLVTSDGTYATQSVFSTVALSKKEDRPPLRQYLMEGDFFIGASVASTLAKLALRYISRVDDPALQNAFCTESMLIIASILHLGKSGLPCKVLSNDDTERMLFCIRVLSEKSASIVKIFTNDCRLALSSLLAAKQNEEASMNKVKEKSVHSVQVDDPITFLQLTSSNVGSEIGAENVFEASLSQAIGIGGGNGGVVGGGTGTALTHSSLTTSDLLFPASSLNKVTQLTGFSDPVYAEAYVHVNQYDIVLDVFIVNQTGDTLQNCTLELATLGDLKLVEKPQPCVLGPRDFCNIKGNVKVASTENGIIFGNIVDYSL